LLDPAIPFWTYWAFVQNVWMSARNYLGSEWLRVTWSLAVEVQFYAFIGVVVYLVPKAQLGRWLAGLTIAVVGFRYAVVGLNPSATTPLVLLLPSRLDAFLLGGLVALQPAAAPGRAGRRQGVALGILVLAVAAFEGFAVGAFGSYTRWVLPAYYLFLSIGCAALLDLCAGSSPVVRWLMESAPMIRAGKLSYFVYMFHIPALWMVYRVFSGRAPTLEQASGVGLMVIVLGVIYTAAELSYRFVEEPMIRWSHGFFRRPGPAATATSQSGPG
jgi:peptidoglycan/LPS O-acetylase OafA/YrhL